MIYLKVILNNDDSEDNTKLNLIPLTENISLKSDIDSSGLKNGDLVLVSYNNRKTIFGRLLYGSSWTHVGIFYKEEKSLNEPYIFEASNYDEPYSGQIIRIPFIKWLKINRNQTIGILPINKSVSYEVLNESFERYENKDFGIEDLSLKWLRFLKLKDKSEENSIFKREMVTCNEIVINVLQDCKVYENKYSGCSFLPSSIFNCKVPTINGYFYDKKKEYKFKANNMNLIP